MFSDDMKVFNATVFISIVTSILIEKVLIVTLLPNPFQTVRAEVYTIKIQPSSNHFSSRFNNKALRGNHMAKRSSLAIDNDIRIMLADILARIICAAAGVILKTNIPLERLSTDGVKRTVVKGTSK